MKSTSNLGFVAFLTMPQRGLSISNYKKNERGFTTFYFDVDDDKWKELKIEYNNSEFIIFKSTMENIKNLIE